MSQPSSRRPSLPQPPSGSLSHDPHIPTPLIDGGSHSLSYYSGRNPHHSLFQDQGGESSDGDHDVVLHRNTLWGVPPPPPPKATSYVDNMSSKVPPPPPPYPHGSNRPPTIMGHLPATIDFEETENSFDEPAETPIRRSMSSQPATPYSIPPTTLNPSQSLISNASPRVPPPPPVQIPTSSIPSPSPAPGTSRDGIAAIIGTKAANYKPGGLFKHSALVQLQRDALEHQHQLQIQSDRRAMWSGQATPKSQVGASEGVKTNRFTAATSLTDEANSSSALIAPSYTNLSRSQSGHSAGLTEMGHSEHAVTVSQPTDQPVASGKNIKSLFKKSSTLYNEEAAANTTDKTAQLLDVNAAVLSTMPTPTHSSGTISVTSQPPLMPPPVDKSGMIIARHNQPVVKNNPSKVKAMFGEADTAGTNSPKLTANSKLGGKALRLLGDGETEQDPSFIPVTDDDISTITFHKNSLLFDTEQRKKADVIWQHSMVQNQRRGANVVLAEEGEGETPGRLTLGSRGSLVPNQTALTLAEDISELQKRSKECSVCGTCIYWHGQWIKTRHFVRPHVAKCIDCGYYHSDRAHHPTQGTAFDAKTYNNRQIPPAPTIVDPGAPQQMLPNFARTNIICLSCLGLLGSNESTSTTHHGHFIINYPVLPVPEVHYQPSSVLTSFTVLPTRRHFYYHIASALRPLYINNLLQRSFKPPPPVQPTSNYKLPLRPEYMVGFSMLGMLQAGFQSAGMYFPLLGRVVAPRSEFAGCLHNADCQRILYLQPIRPGQDNFCQNQPQALEDEKQTTLLDNQLQQTQKQLQLDTQMGRTMTLNGANATGYSDSHLQQLLQSTHVQHHLCACMLYTGSYAYRPSSVGNAPHKAGYNTDERIRWLSYRDTMYCIQSLFQTLFTPIRRISQDLASEKNSGFHKQPVAREHRSRGVQTAPASSSSIITSPSIPPPPPSTPPIRNLSSLNEDEPLARYGEEELLESVSFDKYYSLNRDLHLSSLSHSRNFTQSFRLPASLCLPGSSILSVYAPNSIHSVIIDAMCATTGIVSANIHYSTQSTQLCSLLYHPNESIKSQSEMNQIFKNLNTLGWYLAEDRFGANSSAATAFSSPSPSPSPSPAPSANPAPRPSTPNESSPAFSPNPSNSAASPSALALQGSYQLEQQRVLVEQRHFIPALPLVGKELQSQFKVRFSLSAPFFSFLSSIQHLKSNIIATTPTVAAVLLTMLKSQYSKQLDQKKVQTVPEDTISFSDHDFTGRTSFSIDRTRGRTHSDATLSTTTDDYLEYDLGEHFMFDIDIINGIDLPNLRCIIILHDIPYYHYFGGIHIVSISSLLQHGFAARNFIANDHVPFKFPKAEHISRLQSFAHHVDETKEALRTKLEMEYNIPPEHRFSAPQRANQPIPDPATVANLNAIDQKMSIAYRDLYGIKNPTDINDTSVPHFYPSLASFENPALPTYTTDNNLDLDSPSVRRPVSHSMSRMVPSPPSIDSPQDIVFSLTMTGGTTTTGFNSGDAVLTPNSPNLPPPPRFAILGQQSFAHSLFNNLSGTIASQSEEMISGHSIPPPIELLHEPISHFNGKSTLYNTIVKHGRCCIYSHIPDKDSELVIQRYLRTISNLTAVGSTSNQLTIVSSWASILSLLTNQKVQFFWLICHLQPTNIAAVPSIWSALLTLYHTLYKSLFHRVIYLFSTSTQAAQLIASSGPYAPQVSSAASRNALHNNMSQVTTKGPSLTLHTGGTGAPGFTSPPSPSQSSLQSFSQLHVPPSTLTVSGSFSSVGFMGQPSQSGHFGTISSPSVPPSPQTIPTTALTIPTNPALPQLLPSSLGQFYIPPLPIVTHIVATKVIAYIRYRLGFRLKSMSIGSAHVDETLYLFIQTLANGLGQSLKQTRSVHDQFMTGIAGPTKALLDQSSGDGATNNNNNSNNNNNNSSGDGERGLVTTDSGLVIDPNLDFHDMQRNHFIPLVVRGQVPLLLQDAVTVEFFGLDGGWPLFQFDPIATAPVSANPINTALFYPSNLLFDFLTSTPTIDLPVFRDELYGHLNTAEDPASFATPAEAILRANQLKSESPLDNQFGSLAPNAPYVSSLAPNSNQIAVLIKNAQSGAMHAQTTLNSLENAPISNYRFCLGPSIVTCLTTTLPTTSQLFRTGCYEVYGSTETGMVTINRSIAPRGVKLPSAAPTPFITPVSNFTHLTTTSPSEHSQPKLNQLSGALENQHANPLRMALRSVYLHKPSGTLLYHNFDATGVMVGSHASIEALKQYDVYPIHEAIVPYKIACPEIPNDVASNNSSTHTQSSLVSFNPHKSNSTALTLRGEIVIRAPGKALGYLQSFNGPQKSHQQVCIENGINPSVLRYCAPHTAFLDNEWYCSLDIGEQSVVVEPKSHLEPSALVSITATHNIVSESPIRILGRIQRIRKGTNGEFVDWSMLESYLNQKAVKVDQKLASLNSSSNNNNNSANNAAQNGPAKSPNSTASTHGPLLNSHSFELSPRNRTAEARRMSQPQALMNTPPLPNAPLPVLELPQVPSGLSLPSLPLPPALPSLPSLPPPPLPTGPIPSSTSSSALPVLPSTVVVPHNPNKTVVQRDFLPEDKTGLVKGARMISQAIVLIPGLDFEIPPPPQHLVQLQQQRKIDQLPQPNSICLLVVEQSSLSLITPFVPLQKGSVNSTRGTVINSPQISLYYKQHLQSVIVDSLALGIEYLPDIILVTSHPCTIDNYCISATGKILRGAIATRFYDSFMTAINDWTEQRVGVKLQNQGALVETIFPSLPGQQQNSTYPSSRPLLTGPSTPSRSTTALPPTPASPAPAPTTAPAPVTTRGRMGRGTQSRNRDESVERTTPAPRPTSARPPMPTAIAPSPPLTPIDELHLLLQLVISVVSLIGVDVAVVIPNIDFYHQLVNSAVLAQTQQKIITTHQDQGPTTLRDYIWTSLSQVDRALLQLVVHNNILRLPLSAIGVDSFSLQRLVTFVYQRFDFVAGTVIQQYSIIELYDVINSIRCNKQNIKQYRKLASITIDNLTQYETLRPNRPTRPSIAEPSTPVPVTPRLREASIPRPLRERREASLSRALVTEKPGLNLLTSLDESRDETVDKPDSYATAISSSSNVLMGPAPPQSTSGGGRMPRTSSIMGRGLPPPPAPSMALPEAPAGEEAATAVVAPKLPARGESLARVLRSSSITPSGRSSLNIDTSIAEGREEKKMASPRSALPLPPVPIIHKRAAPPVPKQVFQPMPLTSLITPPSINTILEVLTREMSSFLLQNDEELKSVISHIISTPSAQSFSSSDQPGSNLKPPPGLQSIRTVTLVTGATGHVGMHLLKQLLFDAVQFQYDHTTNQSLGADKRIIAAVRVTPEDMAAYTAYRKAQQAARKQYTPLCQSFHALGEEHECYYYKVAAASYKLKNALIDAKLLLPDDCASTMGNHHFHPQGQIDRDPRYPNAKPAKIPEKDRNMYENSDLCVRKMCHLYHDHNIMSSDAHLKKTQQTYPYLCSCLMSSVMVLPIDVAQPWWGLPLGNDRFIGLEEAKNNPQTPSDSTNQPGHQSLMDAKYPQRLAYQLADDVHSIFNANASYLASAVSIPHSKHTPPSLLAISLVLSRIYTVAATVSHTKSFSELYSANVSSLVTAALVAKIGSQFRKLLHSRYTNRLHLASNGGVGAGHSGAESFYNPNTTGSTVNSSSFDVRVYHISSTDTIDETSPTGAPMSLDQVFALKKGRAHNWVKTSGDAPQASRDLGVVLADDPNKKDKQVVLCHLTTAQRVNSNVLVSGTGTGFGLGVGVGTGNSLVQSFDESGRDSFGRDTAPLLTLNPSQLSHSHSQHNIPLPPPGTQDVVNPIYVQPEDFVFSGYRQSKLVGERLLVGCCRSWGVPLLVFNCGHVTLPWGHNNRSAYNLDAVTKANEFESDDETIPSEFEHADHSSTFDHTTSSIFTSPSHFAAADEDLSFSRIPTSMSTLKGPSGAGRGGATGPEKEREGGFLKKFISSHLTSQQRHHTEDDKNKSKLDKSRDGTHLEHHQPTLELFPPVSLTPSQHLYAPEVDYTDTGSITLQSSALGPQVSSTYPQDFPHSLLATVALQHTTPPLTNSTQTKDKERQTKGFSAHNDRFDVRMNLYPVDWLAVAIVQISARHDELPLFYQFYQGQSSHLLDETSSDISRTGPPSSSSVLPPPPPPGLKLGPNSPIHVLPPSHNMKQASLRAITADPLRFKDHLSSFLPQTHRVSDYCIYPNIHQDGVSAFELIALRALRTGENKLVVSDESSHCYSESLWYDFHSPMTPSILNQIRQSQSKLFKRQTNLSTKLVYSTMSLLTQNALGVLSPEQAASGRTHVGIAANTTEHCLRATQSLSRDSNLAYWSNNGMRIVLSHHQPLSFDAIVRKCLRVSYPQNLPKALPSPDLLGSKSISISHSSSAVSFSHRGSSTLHTSMNSGQGSPTNGAGPMPGTNHKVILPFHTHTPSPSFITDLFPTSAYNPAFADPRNGSSLDVDDRTSASLDVSGANLHSSLGVGPISTLSPLQRYQNRGVFSIPNLRRITTQVTYSNWLLTLLAPMYCYYYDKVSHSRQQLQIPSPLMTSYLTHLASNTRITDDLVWCSLSSHLLLYHLGVTPVTGNQHVVLQSFMTNIAQRFIQSTFSKNIKRQSSQARRASSTVGL